MNANCGLKKMTLFMIFLFPYATEKRTYVAFIFLSIYLFIFVSKWCKFPSNYFLRVLLSLPFNKLPF